MPKDAGFSERGLAGKLYSNTIGNRGKQYISKYYFITFFFSFKKKPSWTNGIKNKEVHNQKKN